MPQSQEHLEIVDLLGVTSAVVALTKVDLVDGKALDAVIADIEERLAKTSLQGSKIVPVSATTGEGLEDLVGVLEEKLLQTPPAPDLGRPRLWVDRVFTIKGSGTVVTGTLVGGSLSEGMDVEVLPTGEKARVRSLQSHEKPRDNLPPGNRCALNLVGPDRSAIRRGDVIVAPNAWLPTTRIGVALRLLDPEDASKKGAFKLHLGSSETDVKLKIIGEQTAVIELDKPIVADFGDPFVLRDVGRRKTIGGGTVVEPHLPAYTRRDPQLAESLEAKSGLDRHGYLRRLISERGHLSRKDALRLTGIDPDSVEDTVSLDSYLISMTQLNNWADEVSQAAREFQEANPLEPGLMRSRAYPLISPDQQLASEVIGLLDQTNVLVTDSEVIRTPDFDPSVGGPHADELVKELRAAGSSPPRAQELFADHDGAVIRGLIRAGTLIEVSADLLFLEETLEEIGREVAASINGDGPITVGRFRDLIGTTRKYAVPLLEYFDRTGLTRRQGDQRVLANS
jgi:selenocysteine-specific elongation factor